MNIVWEEPPVTRISWGSIVEELKKHPGRWAKVQENGHTSTATRLKSDYAGLEIRTVTAGLGYEPNRADIYARWIGDHDG